MSRNSKTIDRSGELASAEEILHATEPQEIADPGGQTNATSSGANGQAGIINSTKGSENPNGSRPAANGANSGSTNLSNSLSSSKDVENPLSIPTTSEPIARQERKEPVRRATYPPSTQRVEGSHTYPLAPVRRVDIPVPSDTPALQPIPPTSTTAPRRVVPYNPPTPYGAAPLPAPYTYPGPSQHMIPSSSQMYASPAPMPYASPNPAPHMLYGSGPFPYPRPPEPYSQYPSITQSFISTLHGPPGINLPGAASMRTPQSYSGAPTPQSYSGAPTPQSYSGAPTPQSYSGAPTPQSYSGAPTPQSYSDAPTPQSYSGAPTPQSYSGAPTPQSYLGAPTPQSYYGAPTPSYAGAPPQSYASGTPADTAQTHSSSAAYPQPPQSHGSTASIGFQPNAPRMPYSDLPQQQPIFTTVRPTIIPSRKKTDAFVANDPFRPHSSRVDKPSDNLTFDDIPMPGAPWSAAPLVTDSHKLSQSQTAPPTSSTDWYLPGQSTTLPPSQVSDGQTPMSQPPPVLYDPRPLSQIPPHFTSPATKPPQQPEPVGRPSSDTNPPDHTPLEPISETTPTNEGGSRPSSPASDNLSSPYRHPTSYLPSVETPTNNPYDPHQMYSSPILPNRRPYDLNDPSTFPTSHPHSPIYSRPYSPPIVRDSFWSRVSDFFRWPFGRPMSTVPPPPICEPSVSSWDTTSSWEEERYTKAAINFVTGTLPSQMYLNLLLRLPSLYFSRVARIFEEADLTISQIKKMALETASLGTGDQFNMQVFESNVLPQYKNLKSTWESFINSVMREWKTFNIISVLLLSAILTILQIETAANDPVTRYTAICSLICALISLLFGCMYIIRFGSMRKTYKAAEWALEAQKTKTVIWWNVWVLLAMPAVWLTWSIVLYITCIMSFVWRTSAQDSGPPATLSSSGLLIVRIIVTVVLGLGILYGSLIMGTFRRYGDAMDRAWKERIDGWIEEKAGHQPSSYIPPSQYQPGSYGPYLNQYGSTYQPPMQNIPSYANPGYEYSSGPQVRYTGSDSGPTYASESYAPPPEPYDSPSQSHPSTPESMSSTFYATRSNTLQNEMAHLEPESKTMSGRLHVYQSPMRNPPAQFTVSPPPSLPSTPATPFIPSRTPPIVFAEPHLDRAISRLNLNLLSFSSGEEDADVHKNRVRFRSPLVSAQRSVSPWGGTSFAGSESPSTPSDININVTGIGDQARTPTDAAQVTADSPGTSSGTNAATTSQENADCEDTV